ncbi:polyhydroxyalkanoate synthesis repressor PhaR [Oceanicaulis alexandrii]|uniref:polyhydroxyalkanoate synthesis repressor PhaR n=1 Tax=Oceanicaulis TaxID=153232 RepID=UPI0035D02058
MTETKKSDVVTIKKYANRRLYDTSASRYVTLDHLRELVREGRDFKVIDAKSGDDLTRGVLAQIIFEEESKGETLLPVEFLRQLISFYGDSMQSMVPSYLQMSMDTLSRQHQAMREKMTGAMGDAMGGNSMAMLEEQTKRNMAMFQQAMSMFTPFSTGAAMGDMPAAPASDAPRSDDVQSLRDELEAMRQKLDQLANKS